MRIPPEDHLARPWRIHELVPDFRLEDVWALPTPGGADEFATLVEGFARFDPAEVPAGPARWLWNLRFALGAKLGWDDPAAGPGSRVARVRDRLPDDLREGPSGPPFALPFEPLYLLDREFAAEIANKTMHGVMHLSWVQAARGSGYHGVMAVYVDPNGWFGDAYMAAIRPFRYHLVYPPLMRHIERQWERRAELQRAV
jgi:hypothetical protein